MRRASRGFDQVHETSYLLSSHSSAGVRAAEMQQRCRQFVMVSTRRVLRATGRRPAATALLRDEVHGLTVLLKARSAAVAALPTLTGCSGKRAGPRRQSKRSSPATRISVAVCARRESCPSSSRLRLCAGSGLARHPVAECRYATRVPPRAAASGLTATSKTAMAAAEPHAGASRGVQSLAIRAQP